MKENEFTHASMKEEILESPSLLNYIEHFTASFWDFKNDKIYWADKCKCGSDLDEYHNCIALKEKRNGNQTSGF